MKIKMYLPFKKLLFTFIFNVTLFLILIISIQNSSNKRKVNLLINETVNLPISFIIGISFLSGSITGSFINTYFDD
tara:strand:- start:817 stop:1044 length:228 start_codon:yes stop_codon:yes gene_type:complete